MQTWEEEKQVEGSAVLKGQVKQDVIMPSLNLFILLQSFHVWEGA